MPPLTFLKAKKIDSIRYPYRIQTISNIQQQRLHTNKATDKGSGTTKAGKQPKVTREHPKQQRRRTGEMLQATEEKAAKANTKKAADERIRFGETTSPQGG